MNPPPPHLLSYTTIAYIEVSIDLPSPLPSFTTSASSEASMKTSSPYLFSYTTSAHSGASENPPSSPSLLNLSLQ